MLGQLSTRPYTLISLTASVCTKAMTAPFELAFGLFIRSKKPRS